MTVASISSRYADRIDSLNESHQGDGLDLRGTPIHAPRWLKDELVGVRDRTWANNIKSMGGISVFETSVGPKLMKATVIRRADEQGVASGE